MADTWNAIKYDVHDTVMYLLTVNYNIKKVWFQLSTHRLTTDIEDVINESAFV